MEKPSMAKEKNAFDYAVLELSKLPGIGEKTAERLVFHLLKQPESQVRALADSIHDLPEKMQYCRVCHYLTDSELCEFCENPKREAKTLCVVEMPPDVTKLERICDYRGHYHVLGGRYSPLEGIFPEDLNIDTLQRRIQHGDFQEVILAMNPNTEGEATSELVKQSLSKYSVKVSRLATGMAYGSEIEWSSRGALRDAFNHRREFA